MSASGALFLIAFVAYVISAGLYGASFAMKTDSAMVYARPAVWIGFLFHTLSIGATCLITHHGPFISTFSTFSATAWFLVLLYIPSEARVRPPALGVVTLPVVCLILVIGVARANKEIGDSKLLQSHIINLHVLLMVLSFGLFLLAAACAALYLAQNRSLKRHKSNGWFRRLPPLDTLDRLAYHTTAYGVSLFTLGLVLGVERAMSGGLAPGWQTDPRVLASYILWLIYVFYLIARAIGGWRGSRLNYLLLIGPLVAITIYFLPATAHHFG